VEFNAADCERMTVPRQRGAPRRFRSAPKIHAAKLASRLEDAIKQRFTSLNSGLAKAIRAIA